MTFKLATGPWPDRYDSNAWERCSWGTWARCYQRRTTCRTAHWTAHLDTIGRQMPARQCRVA